MLHWLHRQPQILFIVSLQLTNFSSNISCFIESHVQNYTRIDFAQHGSGIDLANYATMHMYVFDNNGY